MLRNFPVANLILVILTLSLKSFAISTRTVMAVPTSGLTIDGVLEAEWFRAVPADSFVQREPSEGFPASLTTRAYVLYDEDALYVGCLCIDTAPDSIRGRLMRRDNDYGSDLIDIYLDTFHDRRNAYWFTLTAAGVQSDGTLANEMEFDKAFDAIWESAVGRTDSGWVAEIRIPFASIRHHGPRVDGWGFNVARWIERRREYSHWQAVDRERGVHASEMGVLHGLRDIHSAEHVEILPHVIGRWDRPADGQWHSENEIENLGAYLKIVPSASWTVALAYQPDFAQVDVDDEVINLSEYPVYLTEKRPFFLEAKDLFDTAPIPLFYTRRISDPDYGGRISGRWGSVRAAVLAGKNRSRYEELQDAATGRLVWGFHGLHTIGFTGTYLDGYRRRAAAGSVDAQLRWRERDRLLVTAAGVDRTGYDSQPVEARVSFTRDYQLFLGDVSATYRGQDYNINDLGWGDYSNVQMQTAFINKEYYPATTMLQAVGYQIHGWRFTQADGRFPTGGIRFRTWSTTRQNWRIGGGADWYTDYHRRYLASGEYRDNFGPFRPEYHPGYTRQAWVYSDSRQSIEYGAQASYGTFREGFHWKLDPELTVKPRDNWDATATMSWEHVWGTADIDDYQPTAFRVWRLRARYSPTLNLSLRATVQRVEAERTLQTNLLLAWNWHPGSWFYIVYDEIDRRTEPVTYEKPGNRTLQLKWTFFHVVP